ncbi:hypothetical protein FIBSPDRAFT_1045635 [Athelia psychrophila]|uniref:BTB domain-containing protein n=1 Tax=Athelia psychrophila TaxID=1759441 RepID=A0A166HV69_9AGAM|nr:hypothetical protein FIBSPDRAFT_1045635 [Fibularhizoctonia sp. CBS 109695]
MQRTDDLIDLISNPLNGTSLTGLARHPELWFDDGSVILVAEATSFRVHRSILCKHSSVFSDIFGIPQPTNGGPDTFEGCPVIRMHDSAHEFTQLLKACYDPFFPQDKNTISFHYALSILRLSTKYHMPKFRSRSLDELKKHFPSESLSALDKQCKNWNTVAQITNIDIIHAIKIAREADAFELLPCAFARLCNVSIKSAFVVDASTFLEREDLERLAIGRDNMRIAAEDQLFGFILAGQVSDGCTQPAVCNDVMATSAFSIRSLVRRCPFSLNIKADFTSSALCLACRAQYRITNSHAREVAWNSLPKYFDLGSWQELKRSSIDQA